jgi:hypothetical protein
MVTTADRYQVGVQTLMLLGAAVLLIPIPVYANEPGAAAGESAAFQGVTEEPGSCPVQDAEVASGPVSLARCDAGGHGAPSCEVGHGIRPMGVHDGCGISCLEGYYACCRRGDMFSNASCTCEKAPRWPYTPAAGLLLSGRRAAP